MFVEAVSLSQRGVRLVPLGLEHEDGLRAAAADGELWNLRITGVPEPEQTRAYIETALQMTSDNRASAAQMLGLSRQSLYVKLRRYGLGELGADAES